MCVLDTIMSFKCALLLTRSVVVEMHVCAPVGQNMAMSGGGSTDDVAGGFNSHVWDSTPYIVFSIMHKLVATVYYWMNLEAMIKLEDPILYNKSVPAELFRRPQGQQQVRTRT